MLTNSKLGFGLMRLPKDDQGTIIQEQVNQMVDGYMEKGFNYFDTAYVYNGSEEAFKKSVVDRYDRNSFTIADKLPAWLLKSQEDVKRIFQESLDRCGVDYFDFYLLHSVEESHYPTYEKYECFDFLKEMKKQGKIRHIGFSYHDNAELLDRILTEHPEIEFVQLQLNYLDWNNEVIQSKANYEIARKHNKPIIVMEPVKGGTLASFPKNVESIYKTYAPKRSIASWALRYIGSLDGIMTILSGMTTKIQMEDNLNTFTHFKKMINDEYKLVEEVTNLVLSKPVIPCTKCRYCIAGCPMKIEIPELFTAYNSQKIYGESPRYKKYYEKHTNNGKSKASSCMNCKQCEKVCPQHLKITNCLKDVSYEFEIVHH